MTPRTRTTRLVAGALALVAALGTTLTTTASPASSAAPSAPREGRWAPVGEATITPGVQMVTEGSQCTGNFVFTDRRRRVYVGYSAHCAGLGEATDTDGCLTESQPLGTVVRFEQGSSQVTAGEEVGTGRLVYSSWRAMRERGETDVDACAANDFGLVRVDPASVGDVNPSIPVFGGPTGLAPAAEVPTGGSQVYSFGQSSLRPGTALSPRTGLVLSTSFGGWSYDAYTLSPGVPGDSGSGFVDDQGRAFGTLSTLGLAPLPLSNGISDLGRELAYARATSGIRGLRLVRGTEPFTGSVASLVPVPTLLR